MTSPLIQWRGVREDVESPNRRAAPLSPKSRGTELIGRDTQPGFPALHRFARKTLPQAMLLNAFGVRENAETKLRLSILSATPTFLRVQLYPGGLVVTHLICILPNACSMSHLSVGFQLDCPFY